MLSAVPFRVDDVLFIILFGATQQFITTELSELDTSSLRIVFIHVTEVAPTQLACEMRNDISSLGLGPYHGYVRPHPCGPCPILFPGNEGNFLWTIGCAVTDYLRLTTQRSSALMINLSATLGDLISYVGNGGQTAPDPKVQKSMNARKFNPAQHLCTQQQTYVEFTMLLQMAANKQRDELRSGEAQLYDEDDNVLPIYCFEEKDELAPWVEEWILPDPNVIVGGNESCSSGTETLSPRTPRNSLLGNAYLEGRDLASKKRKAEVDYYSSSFYGAGDETGDEQVSK